MKIELLNSSAIDVGWNPRIPINRQTFQKLTAIGGREALKFLIDVCSHKTGQSYKVRAFLYSLWNGRPVSMLDFITLDLEIRCALNAVFIGFGTEFREGGGFFYDDLSDAFKARGLFEWFIEEAEEGRAE